MTSKPGWGSDLKKCLRDILDRCRGSVEPTNIPGEGGERALKGWIAHPFLTELLGWPNEQIIAGERFDIRLHSAESLPVIYIETKAPGHSPSSKEREDFERRIGSYGTLRSAILTNGRNWERLSLTAPRGSVTIEHRYSLDMDHCTEEEIEAFFLPLKAERYIAGGYDRMVGEQIIASVKRLVEGMDSEEAEKEERRLFPLIGSILKDASSAMT